MSAASSAATPGARSTNFGTGKVLYVATYGCQMNERDSEEVLGMLTAQGYAVAKWFGDDWFDA